MNILRGYKDNIILYIMQIYKLVCKDKYISEIYIGSTNCTLNERFSKHKYECNNKKRTKYNYKIYRFIRENGNIQNWEIIGLETFDIDDKKKQLIKEQYYINLLQPQLNTCRSYRTIEQKKETEFSEKIDELNQETDTLLEEIDKWQM